MALEKSKIAGSGPLVPAFEGSQQPNYPGLVLLSRQYRITDYYVNSRSVFRTELGLASRWEITRVLHQLAVGGVKSNLFHRRTSVRRGLSFFPQAQMLKDLSNDVPPVDEANEFHFAGTFGADKRVGFVDLADKVGPAPL